MLWLLIVLSVIAAVFSYLLFAPFYLEINSVTGLCGIRFHRLATVKLVIKNNSLMLDVRIAGWQNEIDLLAKLVSKKRKQPMIKKPKKRRGMSRAKAFDLLKSFRVNRFYLDLDTGNVQLNGILYPGFYWLSCYLDKPVNINFSNQNELVLEVENNLARIIKIIIY